MDLDKIREIAKHLMLERKANLFREKGGKYYHGQSTANLTFQLRKEILPDDSSHDDILTVAAWFHDCAKGIEPHANYGAIIAREALKVCLSVKELDKVCNLINLHCSRKIEKSNYDDYTKLLQDADIIDHFGVHEIWLNIQYHAHTDGTIHDLIEWYKTNFKSSSDELRELLNYRYSKKVFDDRIIFEGEFAKRLYDEGIGNIHNLYNL